MRRCVALDPFARRAALHAGCDGALLRAGAATRTDWAVLASAGAGGARGAAGGGVLEWFAGAAGEHCGARVRPWAGGGRDVPAGWCSWYEHMDRVSAKVCAACRSPVGVAVGACADAAGRG